MFLIFSKKDEFSMNAFNYFVESGKIEEKSNKGWIKLGQKIPYGIVEDSLFITDEQINMFEFSLNINIDRIIFISKHASKHDFFMHTIHYPGNFTKNEFGGKPYSLSKPFHKAMHLFIKKMYEKDSFDELNLKLMVEATHHGPSLERKTAFLEIGPNQKAYYNKNLLSIYVESLKYLINNIDKVQKIEPFVVIGAPHYLDKLIVEKFIEKMKETFSNPTLSHIMPKYSIEKMIQQNSFNVTLSNLINVSKPKAILINKSYSKQVGKIKETIKEIKSDVEIITLK